MTPGSLVAWVDLGLGVATICLFLHLMVSPWVTGRRLDVSYSCNRATVILALGLRSLSFAV
jgi:hypothetical protein